MAEGGEDMMSLIYSVRDSKLSVRDARERIGQIAEAARLTSIAGSDGRILLDIAADAASAYLNLIEEHPGDPRFNFDPALEAVKRKLERL